MRTLISIAVPATTFVLLVGVGLALTSDDFARVRRQLPLVLTGLLAPLVLLPPIAIGLTTIFRATPEVAAGVLLVAACPIGGISNSYSYLARASPALSVTLTGLSCLCAAITIPALGRAFELALARPLGIEAPLSVLAAQLLFLLAFPIALGMWARQRAANSLERYSRVLQRLAFIGIAVVLALVIATDPHAYVAGLATTVPLAAAFVVASTVAGWLTAAMVTRDRRDRFTIAAEFGTRNIGVATAIAVTLLGRVDFARFTATYAVTEVPLMLAAIALFRVSTPHAPGGRSTTPLSVHAKGTNSIGRTKPSAAPIRPSFD